MRVLLDTHFAIWTVHDTKKLSAAARAILTDGRNTFHVSIVSMWEIAIKFSRGGAGKVPFGSEEALNQFRAAGMELVPILEQELATLETLPRLHKDPFDRLLVAQALTSGFRLLTHDPDVAGYSDTIILA